MVQPRSTQPEICLVLGPRRAVLALIVVGVVIGAVLLLGALGLWFHYGTAVFFEMIASGISACF